MEILVLISALPHTMVLWIRRPVSCARHLARLVKEALLDARLVTRLCPKVTSSRTNVTSLALAISQLKTRVCVLLAILCVKHAIVITQRIIAQAAMVRTT